MKKKQRIRTQNDGTSCISCRTFIILLGIANLTILVTYHFFGRRSTSLALSTPASSSSSFSTSSFPFPSSLSLFRFNPALHLNFFPMKNVLRSTLLIPSNSSLINASPSTTKPSIEGKNAPEDKKVTTTIVTAEPSMTITPLINDTKTSKYEGVCATIFLGPPRWFTNRYGMMISNVYAMLPKGWVIQIFYDPSKPTARDGIEYPSIKRLINKGIIHITPIPAQGAKKKDLMVSHWLWEQMLADRVFFFGGSGVMCSNSPRDILDFNKFQFITDGDGLFSSRNRTLMIEALNDFMNKATPEQQGLPLQGPKKREITPPKESMKFPKDDEILNKYILANLKQLGDPLLPTQQDIEALANGPLSTKPLAVFGTLPAISTQARSEFVEYCPEMKTLFPSLIANDCFGASPEPVGCMEYLCKEGGLASACRETNKSVEFIAQTKRGFKTRLSLSLVPSQNQDFSS